MQQSGELQVVLRSVDGGSGNSRARSELSRLLRLEDRIVGSIIDRAPIILLRDVPAQEAELARGGMTALGSQGITIDLDPEAVGLPKVNWPSPPRLSDLFPVQRTSSAEVDALHTKIAELEGRIAQLEAAVGVSAASAVPAAAAAPAPAAAPAAAPVATPAAPPVPAGPVDGVPALHGELNAPMAEVLDAIPFYETGDNGLLAGSGAAVVQEVTPIAGGGSGIEELEPLDLTDDIGPGEELQPLEALEPVEAPITLEPVDAPADEIQLEPLGDDGGDDELPAWSGRARDYKSDKQKKAAPKQDDDDELEPWTGRARDYKSESKRKAEPEDLPELDLADADDGPVVAPTIVPEPASAIDDGDDLDDLPDLLEPVVEPGKGVKRRKTGSAKKPSKKVAKKASKQVAKKGTSKKAAAAAAPAKKSTKKKAAGDAAYSVFLSKISSAAKKQAAIELLSEIKGIDEDAAAALCGKMIIPVAQGVTKDEAEDILGQFTAHKIQGRITKKRK
ncbi:MAG: hypothetical protein ACYTGX_12490 [Planctomycetota bacterium]|jgi:ribosomal protein L7/L12